MAPPRCLLFSSIQLPFTIYPRGPKNGVHFSIQEFSSIYFSPDSSLYARANRHGGITVRRVADDHEITQLQGPDVLCFTQQFSQDNRFLITNFDSRAKAGDPRRLVLWRLPEGEKLLELDQKAISRGFDFSSDSKLLAVGQIDRTVRIYSTKDGSETARLDVRMPAGLVRFHPENRCIAVSNYYGAEIDILDVAMGKVTSTLLTAKSGFGQGIYDFAWHPKGDVLAVCAGPHFTLWNANGGTLIKAIEGAPLSTIDHLAFSRAGDLLATIAWSGEMVLWDTTRYERVLSAPLVIQHGWGQRLLFGPNDQTLAYDLRAPKARLWELAKGTECLELFGTGKRGAAFHPQGRLVAVTDDEGFRLWDITTSRALTYVKANGNAPFKTVRFHPSGNALVLVRGHALERWPLKFEHAEDQLKIQSGPPEKLLTDKGGNVTLSNDGSLIVLASSDGVCTVVDWFEPSRRQEFGPHPQMMNADISPDKRWVATCTWHGEGGVKIWNRETGKLHMILPELRGNVFPAFSPDGKWLATSFEKGIRFWKVSDWSIGPVIEASVLGALAFSPDSRILAHSSNATLKLYVLPSCQEIATLTPPNEKGFESLAFSPDSSRLAVSALGVLQVWDLRAIRSGLAEMKLDWELPAYQNPPSIVDRRPIEVTVLVPSAQK